MALFECIVPGNLPISNFVQIEVQKWSAPIGFAPESVIVFLTGVEPIPDGLGLGVYLAKESDGVFSYVGHLTNERPSAIFRTPSSVLEIFDGVPVVLGIALESMETLLNLGVTNEQNESQFRAVSQLEIGRRLSLDLYNSVMSYARTLPQDVAFYLGISPNEEVVCAPAAWMDKWKVRIETKMTKDSSWWTSSV